MIEKSADSLKPSIHLKRPSDCQIIKEILLNDMMKSSFIRFLILPILLTTTAYTYMEIKSSGLLADINKAISTQKNQEKAMSYYFGYFFVVLLLSEINGFVFTGVVQYICRITAKCNYENFISLPPNKFNKIGSGEIQTIIERKSKATSELVEIFIINLIPISMKLCFALYAISTVMGIVAGYIMLFCMILYALITLAISIWRANIRRELNKSEAKASDKLQDGLMNHEGIWINSAVEIESKRYDEILAENEINANDLWRVYYVQNFLQRFVFLLQTICIIYAGIRGHLSDLIDTGKFVFFISLTGTVAGSLTNLGQLYTRYTQVMVRISSAHDILLRSDLKIEKPKKAIFNNSIKFENVSFKYNEKIVFNKLNLEINRGDKIAIIGKNGSGKSTLLKILLYIEDYSGEIFIDGDKGSIKEISSYMPKNYFLFNESVLYNLKYGTEDIKDEEIYSLCKEFGMLENICNLDLGFETKVGERGKLLSGGERQKIAIMRSILKKSEVYFLDEPTSALDVKSKDIIIRNLLNDRKKTVLMALNETDFLFRFDKIFFIHDYGIEIVSDLDFYNRRISEDFKLFLELNTN